MYRDTWDRLEIEKRKVLNINKEEKILRKHIFYFCVPNFFQY